MLFYIIMILLKWGKLRPLMSSSRAYNSVGKPRIRIHNWYLRSDVFTQFFISPMTDHYFTNPQDSS